MVEESNLGLKICMADCVFRYTNFLFWLSWKDNTLFFARFIITFYSQRKALVSFLSLMPESFIRLEMYAFLYWGMLIHLLFSFRLLKTLILYKWSDVCLKLSFSGMNKKTSHKVWVLVLIQQRIEGDEWLIAMPHHYLECCLDPLRKQWAIVDYHQYHKTNYV